MVEKERLKGKEKEVEIRERSKYDLIAKNIETTELIWKARF